MFFFSFQLARYFSCFHFFRQTSGCRKTLWLPGQSNRILSKPAPRTSPGLKFPGKTPLLLHRVQKNCLAVQQICFRKKLLVQSVVLAISVENGSFAWNCIHFAENGPPHSLRCLCISLRLYDFWDFSEPLWTRKIGALLRFFFTHWKKLGSFVGFEGSAMWLFPLMPAAWYGTGTCKMSGKT